MKLIILSLSFFLFSCASKPVQTVDDVYNKYGSKPVYEKPYSKENLENQKKYQEQVEKVALEQEKVRKQEEAKLLEEQKLKEKEEAKALLVHKPKPAPKVIKETIEATPVDETVPMETPNVVETPKTNEAPKAPVKKSEDDLDFSKGI